MRITTKEVLQWNSETNKYESILLESYEHKGEVAKCEKYDWDWWTGPNSIWGKITGSGSSSGSASAGDVEVTWGDIAAEESDLLKYGFIVLGVVVILRVIK